MNVRIFLHTSKLSIALVCSLFAASCSSQLPGLDPFAEQNQSTPSAPLSSNESSKTKVALILPLSASGNAGLAAISMRNSAELALAEFQDPTIELLLKDDAGEAQTAASKTQEALNEGAQLILGPLFAQSVSATSQLAKQRSVSVIGFSTDASVASNGVYLLSFLPQNDVNRIISYAQRSGKKSFTALLPDTAYGAVVETALRQKLAQGGGTLVGVAKYQENKESVEQAISQLSQAITGTKPKADTLLIAEGSDLLSDILLTLKSQNIDTKNVQLISTGLWNDPKFWREPMLSGAWFVAPDTNGYISFAERYKNKYGQSPARVASLSYDAVSLAAALAKTKPQDKYSTQTLTNPQGFAGLDGIFRFSSNGLSERGLAIMRITPQGPQVVQPSPKSF